MKDRAGGTILVVRSFREGIEMKRLQYPGPTKVMTVREVADYLPVHPTRIYRLVRRNQIPAFHVGSDWRFNIEEIDRWRLEQQNFNARRNPRQ
jgi:excisionase family DNA binding protein